MSWQKTVVGTVLVNPASYAEANQLRKLDFDIGLQPVWETITKLSDKGSLSPQAVLETLRQSNVLSSIGDREHQGEDFLNHLTAFVDDKGFLAAVENVLHTGIGKQLEPLSPSMAMAIRNGKNPIEVIDEMMDRLLDARRVNTNEVVYIGSLLPGFHEKLVKLRAGEKIGGWHPRSSVGEIVGNVAGTDFIIVAGRGGGGKSSLLRYEALKTAMEGETVITFNGENDPEWYMQYALAFISGIDDMKIRNPKKLSKDEWDRLNEAEETLKSLPWIVAPMKPVKDMTFTCNQLGYKTNRPVLVQVDQIQNLAAGSVFEEIEKTTYDLRNMAMKIGMPVMAAHQHNRSVGHQQDKKPDQHNLLYGGEHAGKQIWSIWEQEMTVADAARFKQNRTPDGTKLLPDKADWGVHLIKVVVSKNSSGRTGVTSEMAWYRGLNDFKALKPGWRATNEEAQIAEPQKPVQTVKSYTKAAQTRKRVEEN